MTVRWRAASIGLVLTAIAAAGLLFGQIIPRGSRRPPSASAQSRLRRAPGVPAAQALDSFGVAVRVNSNVFYLLDSSANAIAGPYSVGAATSLFDAAVTSDGKTAVMSSDLGVTFVDISNPGSPLYLGSTAGISSGRRFVCLTPDDLFAVISRGVLGSFSKEWFSGISVFRVPGQTYVDGRPHYFPHGEPHNAVAAGDGRTLLGNGSVFLLTPGTGEPSRPESSGLPWEKHLAISPDGRTIIYPGQSPDRIGVFRLDGPGALVNIGEIQILGATLGNHQPAFSPDGTGAFVLSGSSIANQLPGPTSLRILSVEGPGMVADSEISIPITPPRIVSIGYYGFKQIGVEPGGRYVFIGDGWSYPQSANPIAVVDLATGSQVKTLDAGTGPVSIAFPARPIQADVGLEMSGDRVYIGFDESVIFSIAAANSGPSYTTAIEISDALPEGLDYVSSTADAGAYDPASGTWDIPVLDPGGSAVLRLTARAVKTGTWTNTATRRSSRGVDPGPANDVASASVTVGPPPDFSDPEGNGLEADVLTARPGRIVTFTVRYHNAGGPALGLRVEATADPNLDSITPLGGGGRAGSLVLWDVGSLGTNSGGQIRFTARVKPGTPAGIKIFVSAEIKPSGMTPTPTNTVAVTVIR